MLFWLAAPVYQRMNFQAASAFFEFSAIPMAAGKL